jgi:hypothetical protein
VTTSYCTCGKQRVETSDNVAWFNLRCQACPDPISVWLETQPWFVKLDEWQHRHTPDCDRHPVVHRCWRWVWRPLCDFADWFHGVPLRVLLSRKGVCK